MGENKIACGDFLIEEIGVMAKMLAIRVISKKKKFP